MRNTGDGANALSAGYPWKAGDELVLPDDEFPANVQPWLPLRKRGVNIRSVQLLLGHATDYAVVSSAATCCVAKASITSPTLISP